jgi:glycosyltransferase involved in cell wall biosynthesis
MGDINEMEAWLTSNIITNVTFLPILPNSLTLKLNYLNRKGIFSYSFYFAFRNWHRQVFKVAQELIKTEKFDLVHNFNPTGYREPGYLWRLNIPYLWGPIGGVQNRPSQLFSMLTMSSKILFTIRNRINTYQFNTSGRLKKAVNAASLLLCSTTENKNLFEQKFDTTVIYVPENAITKSMSVTTERSTDLNSGDVYNILWIGSIDLRKSLNLLIEALAMIEAKNWHLHVIGNGPLKQSMQDLTKVNNIESNITWYGHIPRAEVINLLQIGHLHVITSLGEGTPTTIWETMANGIPTISLNHCGMKDVICERCGVKINIESVQQVKTDLAFAISDLIQNPIKINNLSAGVLECAKSHTWSKRRHLFNGFYDLAIENWKHKRGHI